MLGKVLGIAMMLALVACAATTVDVNEDRLQSKRPAATPDRGATD